jgi:hypothetical protein
VPSGPSRRGPEMTTSGRPQFTGEEPGNAIAQLGIIQPKSHWASATPAPAGLQGTRLGMSG